MSDTGKRMERRDRRAYAIEDMTSEQLATLEKAEIPSEYTHLDAELKDRRP